MSLEGFVRSAGAAMGYARESFGTGAPGPGPTPGVGAAPLGFGAGSGRAAQAFAGESGVLSGHVAALGEHDQAGEQQVWDALAAAGIGRDRMDAVIAAAEADVAAMGGLTNTPAGRRALVAAIKRHLHDTQGTLDSADADAGTRAATANVTAAGYQGIGQPAGGSAAGAAMPGLPMTSAMVPGMAGMPMGLPLSGGGLAGLPLAGLNQLGSLLGSGLRGGGAASSVPDGSAVGATLGAGDLPPGVASERGLQKDTILAARAVSAAFPEIRDIGGWRPDALPWHPNGQAIDVMIPDPTSAHGRALGDAVLRFALQHKDRFDINHVIWRQTMYLPDGSSQVMANRGSPTANHMDHVHIATNGGGYPRGGEIYRW